MSDNPSGLKRHRATSHMPDMSGYRVEHGLMIPGMVEYIENEKKKAVEEYKASLSPVLCAKPTVSLDHYHPLLRIPVYCNLGPHSNLDEDATQAPDEGYVPEDEHQVDDDWKAQSMDSWGSPKHSVAPVKNKEESSPLLRPQDDKEEESPLLCARKSSPPPEMKPASQDVRKDLIEQLSLRGFKVKRLRRKNTDELQTMLYEAKRTEIMCALEATGEDMEDLQPLTWDQLKERARVLNLREAEALRSEKNKRTRRQLKNREAKALKSKKNKQTRRQLKNSHPDEVFEESQPGEHHWNAALNNEIGKSTLFRKPTPPDDLVRERRIQFDSQPHVLGEEAPLNPLVYVTDITSLLMQSEPSFGYKKT